MKKKTDLGKFLKELDKDELIAEIQKLYEKFAVVKTYYRIDLSGDMTPWLDAAKKKIHGIFYFKGDRPRKPKASRFNKVVKDFETISIYKEDVIELLLWRVEESLVFIRDYRYTNEPLFQSTLRAYQRACTLIADNSVQGKYRSRCGALVELSAGTEMQHQFREAFSTLRDGASGQE